LFGATAGLFTLGLVGLAAWYPRWLERMHEDRGRRMRW
jgi:hypothetical protein